MFYGPNYLPEQTIDRNWDGSFIVRWQGRCEIFAKPIFQLPRTGEVASIIASGPSVLKIDQPRSLFSAPIVCVNGSISIAKSMGVRIPYYSVTDRQFVIDKPEIFAHGLELADAIILRPASLFAAMEIMPDLIRRANVYLHDTLSFPFKQSRIPLAEMKHDSRFLVHPCENTAFSLFPTCGTFPAGTVVYPTIQILFGIGYRQLFMFGVDLNSDGRFYREDKIAPTRLEQKFDVILHSFELVQSYCRQTGVTLINCSLGSNLPSEIIPKMDESKAAQYLSDFKKYGDNTVLNLKH